MESNQVKTKEDGSKAEKDRLSELLDAFDKVAERDSKSLERSASSPPAEESITDADGRMRDLVMSLGQKPVSSSSSLTQTTSCPIKTVPDSVPTEDNPSDGSSLDDEEKDSESEMESKPSPISQNRTMAPPASNLSSTSASVKNYVASLCQPGPRPKEQPDNPNCAGPDEVILSRQFFTMLLSMGNLVSMKPFLTHHHYRFAYYPSNTVQTAAAGVTQSVSQSYSLSTSQSTSSSSQPISSSSSQSIPQSISPSISQSVSPSLSQSISQSTSQPISQPIKQPISQPIKQPISQPIKPISPRIIQGIPSIPSSQQLPLQRSNPPTVPTNTPVIMRQQVKRVSSASQAPPPKRLGVVSSGSTIPQLVCPVDLQPEGNGGMKVAQMNVGQQMPVEERRNSASVENPHYIPFELLCMSKAVEQLPVPPVVVQVKNLGACYLSHILPQIGG
ncbi:hypothetical protein WA538_005650 [Blastocystis sp. DL]